MVTRVPSECAMISTLSAPELESTLVTNTASSSEELRISVIPTNESENPNPYSSFEGAHLQKEKKICGVSSSMADEHYDIKKGKMIGTMFT